MAEEALLPVRARPDGDLTMIITGRQIREARALVRWSPERLAKNSILSLDTVTRAELLDSEALIPFVRARAMRGAFEAAGVEFTDGDQPGVRLRSMG